MRVPLQAFGRGVQGRVAIVGSIDCCSKYVNFMLKITRECVSLGPWYPCQLL